MKYMLDIILILGLCVLGWQWNNERTARMELEYELEEVQAKVVRKDKEIQTLQGERDGLKSTLADKTAEATQLADELGTTVEAKAAAEAKVEETTKKAEQMVRRIRELEGYKNRAIVAEMPQVIKSTE